MFAIERQEKILRIVKKKKSISVDELSDIFKVSNVTIRKDLKELEDKGFILRTFGGAVIKEVITSEIPYNNRKTDYIEIKKELASTVCKYITDNISIYLDAGTTTFQVCEYLLGFHGLVIITNDILIASYLFNNDLEKNNNQLIMLGGGVSNKSGSCCDSVTLSTIDKFRTNISIVGCDAIDIKTLDIFTSSADKATLKSKAAKIGNKSILLTGSDKCEKLGLYKFGNCDDFDFVITDNNNNNFIKKLKEKEVEVKINNL
ncbi:DeoR/GlpR family DNA-binding transcription regulator [Anaerococcus sp. AGMB09787]|uniref:DeoR/GlpR family DNA-binding transcription regulator n=1 Tax=Anaerococcus sp. AGMB09787 TaxID=2922869 RepID=UPI001FAEF2F2|nr:DeoR/GlpR family DNA-binding transcription regulator [Anaerococcus sp. AGMB09787]